VGVRLESRLVVPPAAVASPRLARQARAGPAGTGAERWAAVALPGPLGVPRSAAALRLKAGASVARPGGAEAEAALPTQPGPVEPKGPRERAVGLAVLAARPDDGRSHPAPRSREARAGGRTGSRADAWWRRRPGGSVQPGAG
jgi:hypothetical protein